MVNNSRMAILSNFEQFTGGQIFLCNSKTMNDCLSRMLFGSPKGLWHDVKQITKKTAIFLYAVGPTPTLHGVFVAEAAPRLNIDSRAWKGRFPSQVKVRRFHKFPPIPESDLSSIFGDDKNRQRMLSKAKTQAIIQSFVNHEYNIMRPVVNVRQKVFLGLRPRQLSDNTYITTPSPSLLSLMQRWPVIPVYNPRGGPMHYTSLPANTPVDSPYQSTTSSEGSLRRNPPQLSLAFQAEPYHGVPVPRPIKRPVLGCNRVVG